MNTKQSGITIRSVVSHSAASCAGLKVGDSVVAVDGRSVDDELDFRFFTAQMETDIEVLRNGKKHTLHMTRDSGTESGVAFGGRPIRRCANNCVFCFIDQMPPGLRKSLYIKDEDYRYSFTNGNYVTLTRTPNADLQRIAELGLSPLYVSVHVTDVALRKRMLGCARAFDVMEQLKFLEKNYIRFHTQIVVCPGINDGAVLEKTLHDLLGLNEGLLSIAVVPVGLTNHRKAPLAPVTADIARDICRTVGELSDTDAVSTGHRRIFLADELFIKAGLPIPLARYYEDYPQIENGVGLVRQLLDEWNRTRRKLVALGVPGTDKQPVHWAWATSHSAYRFIQKIADGLCKLYPYLTLDVFPVTNYFFGEAVTVAGLLTAKDVIAALRSRGICYDNVVLPAVMFNIRGTTLDGYSLPRISRSLRMPVTAPLTLAELAENIHGTE